MEQLYCAVREDEEREEQQQQLQDGAALKGRQSLQQGKDGMWKCHHCSWTKQFDSPWNLRRGNLNGYFDLLMNVKTMIQHGPCIVCETKGDNIDGAMSALPSNGVNNMEIADEKVPSSVAELPSPNLTEEIDQQLKEYDVEAVLAKQETHDLFCPNCKSCITKMVILRKRKRTTPIPNIDTKPKRDKSAIEVVDSSVDEGNQGDHAIATPDDVARVEPPADNFEPEREPEVFRCLSGFSFFIPIGNAFKLFPSFGGKPEASQKLPVVPASNVENPSVVAASNSNWFFTLFTSIKRRIASAQGDASSEDSIADPTSVEDSRIDNPLKIAQNSYSSLMKEAQSPEQSFDSEVVANDVARDKQNFIVNGSIPSIEDLKKVETGIEDEIKPFVANEKNEAFETATFQAAYVPTEGETHTEIYIAEQPRAEIGEHQEWGILKSIVYGGLVESITSLGVVSSAASSGSAPLNIIALGLANLIGGLSDNFEPPADNFEPEREPEVFRCLSCFSFFIPIGNGFKLFPSFGGKPEASQKLPVVPASNVENPSGVAASNSNWFFTLFTSIKGRKASVQGDASSEDSIADPTSVEDSRIDNPLKIAQNSYSSLMKEAQSPEQSFDSEVVANDVARDKQNFIVNGSIPSIEDLKKVETGIEDEIKPFVANEKNEAFETSTSQAGYVPTEGDIVTEAHTEIYIGEQPRAEIGEHQEWEILKSIVYGGLVESITSLGVVSSAASSGSAPLNIIALGLANLIGGLSVIGHNLTDLKNGHSGGNPSQDRYEELLGRRENFTLHAFLAVLSFIIFGSVPLVVYSLLISKHYYDEYNIAAVTASSVVCIILLAMGKAYTSTPPKSYIKTVLHYVSLALATCGVSYIAGDLAKVLLDKISGSESGYVLAMPLSDTTRMEPA